jgi:hypothetical protein
VKKTIAARRLRCSVTGGAIQAIRRQTIHYPCMKIFGRGFKIAALQKGIEARFRQERGDAN